MRSAIFFAIALCAGSLPSQAWIGHAGGTAPTPTTQVLLGGLNTTTSNAADRYWPVSSTANALATIYRSGAMPFSGTIKALKFWYGATLTGSMTYTATIYINGVASSAACTVNSSSSGMICDWTGSVSVNAGDYLIMDGHPTGTPTTAIVSHSILIQPTTANDTVIFASTNSGNSFSTSSTQGTPAGSSNNVAAISATSRRHATAPDSGTITNLYAATNAPGAAGSGDQYVYTWLKNGSATGAPTCTVLNTATSCNDTSTTLSVSGPASGTTSGDDMELQATPTNSDAALLAGGGGFGVRYLPNTAGHYAIIETTSAAPNRFSTNFLNITMSNGTPASTETSAQNITHAQTIKKMSAKALGAPGTGAKWTITLRVNGADAVDGSSNKLTCDISDTNTGCSVSTTITLNDNDKIDFSIVPVTAPASANIGVSLLATH